ncbi:hypothetical protein M5K25_026550 [Dendrobium thyrsiflorum]|uniref:Reverse transcriptase domain-containing protein n=1 Tax=Dendrobium thyrsiflorum TaxID=117978 RepID=A0ABD0TXT1_DENTH
MPHKLSTGHNFTGIRTQSNVRIPHRIISPSSQPYSSSPAWKQLQVFNGSEDITPNCWIKIFAKDGSSLFHPFCLCLERYHLERHSTFLEVTREAYERERLHNIALTELHPHSPSGLPEPAGGEVPNKEKKDLNTIKESLKNNIVQELHVTLARLSTWWSQRAKASWIEEGDSNSKFFHEFASAKRNRNWIKQKSRNRDCNMFDWPTVYNKQQIDKADYGMLNAEFTREYFSQAVQQLGNNKSPGFEDDILLFSSASPKVADLMKKILNDFCGWTGQKVNNKKSHIFFGKAVNVRMQKKISKKFGFKVVKEMHYLGSSSTWQIVIDGAKYLKLIIRWKLSNGNKVHIINDIWMLDRRSKSWPTFADFGSLNDKQFQHFISSDGYWIFNELQNFFHDDLISLIVQVPLHPEFIEDQVELISQHSGRSIASISYEASLLFDEDADASFTN